MSSNPVVLYRYDASPYSVKIDHALTLKGVPHFAVDVQSFLPRPEISELLGISYRRIPLLAIGNDVYCDTSLITSALERRFPASEGYHTLFPPRKGGGKADTGMIKAFSQFYVDRGLFGAASSTIPWEKLPPAFLKDRSELRGVTIKPEQMVAARPQILSLLSSHMALLEGQLSDGREWLFDTETPSLADLATYFIYAWIKPFRTAKSIFEEEKLEYSLQWMARMSGFLSSRKSSAEATKISGDKGASVISSSAHEPYDVVGFDEAEARRLDVQAGGLVSVTPDDTGRTHPTTGKLVAINKEECTLEVQGSSSIIRCHFPRLGFTVKAIKDVKSKL